jgi:hypothetical protein
VKPIPPGHPQHGVIKTATMDEAAMRDHLIEHTKHMQQTADYGAHGLSATPRGAMAGSGAVDYQTSVNDTPDCDGGGNMG